MTFAEAAADTTRTPAERATFASAAAMLARLPRTYAVDVSHPTDFHRGTHTLTVKTNANGNTVYVSGTPFGCSRDYNTTNDASAIRQFLAEHACTPVGIRPAPSIV